RAHVQLLLGVDARDGGRPLLARQGEQLALLLDAPRGLLRLREQRRVQRPPLLDALPRARVLLDEDDVVLRQGLEQPATVAEVFEGLRADQRAYAPALPEHVERAQPLSQTRLHLGEPLFVARELGRRALEQRAAFVLPLARRAVLILEGGERLVELPEGDD